MKKVWNLKNIGSMEKDADLGRKTRRNPQNMDSKQRCGRQEAD
jgi:hypothetical protein